MANWWEQKVDQDSNTVWKSLKTADGVDYYFNTETQETSWDKPYELMTDEEKAQGDDWYWIPDAEDAFVPARLIKQSGPKSEVELEDGSRQVVSSKDLSPLKKSSLHPKKVVADLTLLDDMTPPLILWNLKQRFLKDLIYTNVGNILIAINPYKWGLPYYTHAVKQRYIHRGTEDRDPHVYNIAHDAYVGLTEFNQMQSIIISGESGAGKTEAAKQCLDYMAEIAGSVGGVEKKVLQSNPILEAFGNAKTVRNDNSSRFGKYMEVFFNQDWMIYASTTTNYLLEKIRVVQPALDERNFHIFYQLTKAATSKQKKKYGLMGPGDYHYTAGGGTIDLPQVDDVQEFKELNEAFKELLFSKADVDNLFQTVSAILAMGNIKFGQDRNDHSTIDKSSDSLIQWASRNLAVDEQACRKALSFRTLKIPGQKSTDVPFSQKEASDARHALAKFIYGYMFDWIVMKVNRSMVPPRGDLMSIGILDIFGFEIFKENSFEQLCINFTNEMLQQHFNQNTFKLEQQLYRAEQIQFDHVDHIDNQPMIDLITARKPLGIIPLLDEELNVPRGSDAGFLDKANRTHSKNKVYKVVFKRKNTFCINHYAGAVNYDVVGFLDKNRDRLTDDLLSLLNGSSSEFIQELFSKKVSAKSRKASLGYQFTQQLFDLVKALNRTEPHYIRCIKPNEQKAAMTFVASLCFEQLTYSGVFEAVAIRKQGFPFRLKHEEFKKRYTCIVPEAEAVSNAKKACDTIVKKLKLNSKNVRAGLTMMLYRAEEHKMLELQRSIRVKSKEIAATLRRITSEDHESYGEEELEEFLNRLAKAVMLADEFRIKTKIADKARDLLDHFIQSRLDRDPECKNALLEAEASMDVAALEAALEMADERGYQACHLVRRIRELWQKISEADRMLQEAKANVPAMEWHTDQLHEAVEHADSIDYQAALVEECRALAHRIDRLHVESEAANETLDEDHVKAVVAAAEELNFTNAYVDYFRSLVYGPQEEFLQAQLDKANELGDSNRAIRVTIQLQDIWFQNHGASAPAPKNYKSLKTPQDWAGEKFFGSKAKRAQRFMKWQKAVIHSPLVQYNKDKTALKQIKKDMIDSHKAILKFCGQRKTQNLEGRVVAAMTMGQNNPEYRDEMYLHVLKHMTDIQDPETPDALDKAWKYFALMLDCFAPSEELRPTLEAYLRQNRGRSDKWNLTGIIARTVYNGGKGVIPSVAVVQDPDSHLQQRSQGFEAPPTSGQSYADLLEPFDWGASAGGGGRRGGGGGRGKRGGGGGKKKGGPPRKKKNNGAWQKIFDQDSGEYYYANEETQETQWEPPPGWQD